MAKANTNTNTTPAAATANTSAAPANNPAAPPAPVLNKYTTLTTKLGSTTALPSNFKYASTHLYTNLPPKGATSVMGIVYAMVKANPGITGAQLVALMQQHTWVGHPSAYTKGGVVCALWCVGYINGTLRAKHMHLKAGTAPQASK